MNKQVVGFDVPAMVGMSINDIATPSLVLDLDALEWNIQTMGRICKDLNIGHRAHGKMHKSADVAKLQMSLGGAVGICCQKVSEAEAFARAGINNILITNQVVGSPAINRLIALVGSGIEIACCVDHFDNVKMLEAAAQNAGVQLNCLVEIDCGAGRCGVVSPQEAGLLASYIHQSSALSFQGLQAYQGALQHLQSHQDRFQAAAKALHFLEEVLRHLHGLGLSCAVVGGGGTGSFLPEAQSGLYTELQCGSYAFMDADYGRIEDEKGERLDAHSWKNALFLLTRVMSKTRSGLAVCDAGLKSQSVDSGLPLVSQPNDLRYIKCSDEHGILEDEKDSLAVGDLVYLIPGHCDPTCNLHDWYVGIRGGLVESVWPITARGKSW